MPMQCARPQLRQCKDYLPRVACICVGSPLLELDDFGGGGGGGGGGSGSGSGCAGGCIGAGGFQSSTGWEASRKYTPLL